MSDFDNENEQDFTGAIIEKIKELFQNRVAVIIMAVVVAVVAVIIILVSVLPKNEQEDLDAPSALAQTSEDDTVIPDDVDISGDIEQYQDEVTESALNYTMERVDPDSLALSFINSQSSAYRLSVEIAAAGYPANDLTASVSGYSAFLNNESIRGPVVDLRYTPGYEVEKVRLMFEIRPEEINNNIGTYPTGYDFNGINRFNIFMYDEELNMQLPIETSFDTENNIVYAETDRLGTFSLVDMEIWFSLMGIAEPEITDFGQDQLMME